MMISRESAENSKVTGYRNSAKRSAIFTAVAMVMTSGLIVTGASTAAEASPETRIGTVNMQRALQNVEAGKNAKAQLEKTFNAKKKELQNEEAAIKKMGEEYKKQSAVMSEEARARKQGEIQERIMRFQELTARSQAEIQQEEQKLTEPIIGRLRTIIGDLANQKGYTVVLEKSENTVLFSQDKDDLTEEVIQLFNKQPSGKTEIKKDKKS